jgi:hypothetical protein
MQHVIEYKLETIKKVTEVPALRASFCTANAFAIKWIWPGELEGHGNQYADADPGLGGIKVLNGFQSESNQ